MKKSNFEKIQEKYFRGRIRLESVTKGDLVWEDTGLDLCPLVVKDVNVDEDYIDAIEISMAGNREIRYEHFVTESEMIERGFTREILEEERKKYSGIIKMVMESKI